MENGSLEAFETNAKIVLEPTIWVWLSQALTGLSLLADHHLMHCDIKPGNLLLDEHYNLKIADFGFLKVSGPQSPVEYFGTAEYQPPEAYAGETAGTNLDIWALAVAFINVLTARFPWPHDTRPKQHWERREETKVGHRALSANGRFQLTRVAQFVPSQSLQRLLCDRMLQSDPALRASARELLNSPELVAVLHQRATGQLRPQVQDQSIAETAPVFKTSTELATEHRDAVADLTQAKTDLATTATEHHQHQQNHGVEIAGLKGKNQRAEYLIQQLQSELRQTKIEMDCLQTEREQALVQLAERDMQIEANELKLLQLQKQLAERAVRHDNSCQTEPMAIGRLGFTTETQTSPRLLNLARSPAAQGSPRMAVVPMVRQHCGLAKNTPPMLSPQPVSPPHQLDKASESAVWDSDEIASPSSNSATAPKRFRASSPQPLPIFTLQARRSSPPSVRRHSRPITAPAPPPGDVVIRVPHRTKAELAGPGLTKRTKTTLDPVVAAAAMNVMGLAQTRPVARSVTLSTTAATSDQALTVGSRCSNSISQVHYAKHK